MADGPSFPTNDVFLSAANALTPAPEASPAPSPAPEPVRPSAPETSVTLAEVATEQAQAERQTPPATSEAVETPAAPAPRALDPNEHYEVRTKVDGVEKVEILTGKELNDRNMNARKFTQSMQKVREFERTLAQERQGILQLQQQARRAAEYEQALADPATARARFPHLFTQSAPVAPQAPVAPVVPARPSLDPQAIPLFEDVQTAVSQRAAELQEQMGRELSAREQAILASVEQKAAQVFAEKIGKLQEAAEVASYDRQINAHIDSLKNDHPVLAKIPQINDLMRWQVMQMRPNSPQEMLDAFTELGKAYAEEFDEHYREQSAARLATKAKLVTAGAEAPAGRTPTITPVKNTPFVRGGKADWGSVTEAANSFARR